MAENAVRRNSSLKPKTTACFVCGPENSFGLRVPFAPDGENGSRALYIARPEHVGWPGLLHGGVALSLMDEALGWALYFQGLSGLTARVDVRFRRPIAIGTAVVIRAWTVEQRRRLVAARAEIKEDSQEMPLLAEADASMYLT